MRVTPPVSDRRACARLAVAALCAVIVGGCAAATSRVPRETPDGLYSFYLRGGYFYGPGPIVPDTLLPDGRLSNIHFDLEKFRGYAEFYNDGVPQSKLSDGKTRINQNIDAGLLHVGGGTNPILLAAVDGGPHRGTEEYYFDEHYRFVWRVDLALDPGFPEGIIRIDDFVLHTGVAQVAQSLQSAKGLPGGYDQAGTLDSGRYLVGRVGDFDQDGYLDGVLVATPNVPLAADMLPGAPVGNQRGFITNVPLTPHVSAELIVRGAAFLEEPIQTMFRAPNYSEVRKLIAELNERARAARRNMERTLDGLAFASAHAKSTAQRLTARLDVVEVSSAQALKLLDAGPVSPAPSKSELAHIVAAVFGELRSTITEIAALNDATGTPLPRDRVAAKKGATAHHRRRSRNRNARGTVPKDY